MSFELRKAIARLRQDATVQMDQAKGKRGSERSMYVGKALLLTQLAHEFEEELKDG